MKETRKRQKKMDFRKENGMKRGNNVLGSRWVNCLIKKVSKNQVLRISFNVVCSLGVINRHRQLIQFHMTIRLERETKLEKNFPFIRQSEPLNSQRIQ